ncbi:MAG: hypothetical protein AB1486_16815 [Planctomycetota bacterium]
MDMPRIPGRRWAAPPVMILLGLALTLMLSRHAAGDGDLSSCVDEPWGQQDATSLDDVFTCDGILTDLLHRPLDQFDVQPPPAPDEPIAIEDDVLVIKLRYSGMRFQGYDKRDSSCIREATSRIQVEIRCPLTIDFSSPPLLNVEKGDEENADLDSLIVKRALAKLMAANGILSAIWFEVDEVNEDGTDIPDTIAQKLGYNGDGDIYAAHLDWLKLLYDLSHGPRVQHMRLDFRFAYTQGYMLTTTFVQEYLKFYLPALGYDPATVAPWLDSVRVVYSGGSKRGSAMAIIGGIDPRAVGVRMKGNEGLESGPKGSSGRYIFDWGYCPNSTHEDHLWAPFATWKYLNESMPSPNYSDIYVPANDPDRYAHLLFLDIVGTHDWINPLGSHETFWRARDGLDDSGNPDGSEWWNFRTIRRPNRNHGVIYEVGHLPDQPDPGPVGAQDVVLWWALQNLKDPTHPFPRMEIARAWIPPLTPTAWKVKVHIPGFQLPDYTQEFHVWVALSDNRDFRRCDSPPILHHGPTEPCHELDGGPGGDPYGEIEDAFYRITPDSVTDNGDFRTLHFRRPSQYTQFLGPPLAALIVEYSLWGPDLDSPWDDLVLFTEVTYLNEANYPLASDCVPPPGN